MKIGWAEFCGFFFDLLVHLILSTDGTNRVDMVFYFLHF
jgi:hypothetical protein